MSNRGTVCVTGANGFLASHIVEQLLSRGYVVHATVRNKNDERKTGHLRKIGERFPGRLLFFNGDLMKEHSFDEAFEGCDVICHVAMPVTMTAKNPQKDIVDPAVFGVKNVLGSVKKNVKSIRKVIYTSSYETLTTANGARSGKIFTEDDWNTEADLSSPYSFGKVVAEKTVLDIFNSEKVLHEKVRLIRLLPGWIAGPSLNPNPPVPLSLEPFLALGSGEYPFCPRISVQVTDVRDCAEAHVLSVEKEFDKDERIAVLSDTVWSMKDICDSCRSHVEFSHIPFASIIMPDFFLLLACLWDKRLSYGYLKNNLGIVYRTNNSKSTNQLGVKYRDPHETTKDTVKYLIEHNLLEKKHSKVTISIVAIVLILILAFVIHGRM